MHILGWFLLVPGLIAVIALDRWMDSIEGLLKQIIEELRKGPN